MFPDEIEHRAIEQVRLFPIYGVTARANPESFAGLASYPGACPSGAGTLDDAIEQTASGNSGLQ